MNIIDGIKEKVLFWVETDVEPDDVQALMMLKEIGEIDVVVSGGSTEPRLVAQSAIKFMHQICPNTNATFLTGFPDNNVYSHRGQEHVNQTLILLPEARAQISIEEYMDEFSTFILRCTAKRAIPVFVSLKPAHEMFHAFTKIDPRALRCVHAIFHMGFNSREVLNANRSDHKKYIEMLNRFGSVRMFSKDSVTRGNCSARLSDMFDSFTETYLGVAHMRLIENWNKHIEDKMKKQMNTLVTNMDGDTYKQIKEEYREFATVDQELLIEIGVDAKDADRFKNILKLLCVLENTTDQFLLADQCAVIASFDKEIDEKRVMVKIDFNVNNDVIFTEVAKDSNLYFYKNVNKETLLNIIKPRLAKFIC